MSDPLPPLLTCLTAVSISTPPTLLFALVFPSCRWELILVAQVLAALATFLTLRVRKLVYSPLFYLLNCIARYLVSHLLFAGAAVLATLALHDEAAVMPCALAGFVLSLVQTLQHQNELVLPLCAVKRRLQIQAHVPRALLVGLLCALGTGVATDTWPVVACTSLALVARLVSLVAVENHGPAMDSPADALEFDRGSPEEALRALPLFQSPAGGSLAFFGADIGGWREWWQAQSALPFKAREQARFQALAQAVYAREAREAGSALASSRRHAGVVRELARARLLQQSGQDAALEAAVCLLDAQTLVLQVLCRARNTKPEAPLLSSGLRDGVFGPDEWEGQDRALAWRERFNCRRLVLGELVWEVDPVRLEFARRNRSKEELIAQAAGRRAWWAWLVERDVETALLADEQLVERASECLAAACRARRDVQLFDLGKLVLSRLAEAIDEADKVLRLGGLASQHGRLLARLAFCVHRDLQVLGV